MVFDNCGVRRKGRIFLTCRRRNLAVNRVQCQSSVTLANALARLSRVVNGSNTQTGRVHLSFQWLVSAVRMRACWHQPFHVRSRYLAECKLFFIIFFVTTSISILRARTGRDEQTLTMENTLSSRQDSGASCQSMVAVAKWHELVLMVSP